MTYPMPNRKLVLTNDKIQVTQRSNEQKLLSWLFFWQEHTVLVL